MTYTMDATQLADFRLDLDLPAAPGVFTDAQLQRFYDRALGDYNKSTVYALRALLMSSAKLHDYTAAQSSESLGQVFKNLEIALKLAEKRAGLGGARITASTIGLNIDATEDNQSEWDGST